MIRRLAFGFSLTLATSVALAIACKGPHEFPTCDDIPEGGCPDDYDADYCSDPTCATLYACTLTGAWMQVGTCPPHPMDGGPDVSSDAPETSLDVNTLADAPPGAFGGPGCVELEMPDCPAGVALLCSGQAGCCGCQDLFVCSNESWSYWGECSDAGVPIAHP